MPGVEVSSSIVIPESELSWRFSRSSGPGGQGVNTADSRVELTFELVDSTVLTQAQKDRASERLGSRLVSGRLTVTASEHRSQLRNRAAAEHRLAALVASAIRPPPRKRRPTKATKASIERRLQAKRRRAQLKRQRSGSTDD